MTDFQSLRNGSGGQVIVKMHVSIQIIRFQCGSLFIQTAA